MPHATSEQTPTEEVTEPNMTALLFLLLIIFMPFLAPILIPIALLVLSNEE